MCDSILLDEQVAAVERAAKGLPSPDVKRQTAALIAAVATLSEERRRRMSASEALDKFNAENEAWLRSVGREPHR
ncbi:hypothetical protein [Rhodoblastus sp.]|uniref:hypothetical protein n=1 Tax=Rhodoblastus sp. TaxID=1962975 RepID=UPI003F96BEC5